MMGIICEEPAFVYVDNKSVLYNTTVTDYTSNKNINNLYYHFVCEGCAQDELRMAYVNKNSNLADLLTKPLPSGEKKRGFERRFVYLI